MVGWTDLQSRFPSMYRIWGVSVVVCIWSGRSKKDNVDTPDCLKITHRIVNSLYVQ